MDFSNITFISMVITLCFITRVQDPPADRSHPQVDLSPWRAIPREASDCTPLCIYKEEGRKEGKEVLLIN